MSFARVIILTTLATLVTILASGCSDSGSGIVPSDDTQSPIVLTVQPDSGRVGSLVSIRGTQFLAGGRYFVAFRGADEELLADSSTGSTIYSFVPFGAVSSPISVQIGERLGQTQRFTVTEVVDTLALVVSSYDVLPPLTAHDSSTIDRMGFLRSWRADVQKDTVHISRGISTGDVYYENHLLLVDRGPGHLPELRALWNYIKTDYGSRYADTVHVDIVKIQDWNPTAVMSGRFFGKQSMRYSQNGSFAFWVDLRR